jgi:hypothetical protein
MEAERLAETLTSEFRTSPEGLWVNLREALSRLGYVDKLRDHNAVVARLSELAPEKR